MRGEAAMPGPLTVCLLKTDVAPWREWAEEDESAVNVSSVSNLADDASTIETSRERWAGIGAGALLSKISIDAMTLMMRGRTLVATRGRAIQLAAISSRGLREVRQQFVRRGYRPLTLRTRTSVSVERPFAEREGVVRASWTGLATVFARKTGPDLRWTRYFRALRRRQRFGGIWTDRIPVFAGAVAARQVRNKLGWRGGERAGG